MGCDSFILMKYGEKSEKQNYYISRGSPKTAFTVIEFIIIILINARNPTRININSKMIEHPPPVKPDSPQHRLPEEQPTEKKEEDDIFEV